MMRFRAFLLLLSLFPLMALPARGSELEKAIAFVGREAAAGARTADTRSDAFRYFAAVSAMTLVHTRLSPILYGAEAAKPNFRPIASPEDALARGIGLCGNHADTFEAIIQAFGIPTRHVQVFWNREGHIFLEVEWGGAWHMFDTTWGFVPRGQSPLEVLSYEQVRAGVPYQPVISRAADAFQRAADLNADVLAYLAAKEVDVVVDLTGVTHPYVVARTENKITFGTANYLPFIGGLGGPYGFGDHVYEISAPAGFERLKLQLGEAACGAGSLSVNGNTVPVRAGPVSMKVSPGPLRIEIVPAKLPCYAFVEAIELEREPPATYRTRPEEFRTSSRP